MSGPRALQVEHVVGLRWRCGEPPKDGKYEMKRRVQNAGGQYVTLDWAEPGWWNGRMYVRRSQVHGGEIALVPPPNRWRALKPNASSTGGSAALENPDE